MDVEKRLLRDAESFADEIKQVDREGAVNRILAFLGFADSETSETSDRTSEAGRIQRPASAGGPDPDNA